MAVPFAERRAGGPNGIYLFEPSSPGPAPFSKPRRVIRPQGDPGSVPPLPLSRSYQLTKRAQVAALPRPHGHSLPRPSGVTTLPIRETNATLPRTEPLQGCSRPQVRGITDLGPVR